VAVVGVAVNWHGAHVLQVLEGDGGEGHDIHLPVIGNTRSRHGCDFLNRKLAMIKGRTGFDGLETEKLPEAVRDVYRGVAHGVARAAARLGRRGDLNMIQAIPAANGRSGRVIEEFAGRTDFISRGDYGNAEGYCVHAGCLRFL